MKLAVIFTQLMDSQDHKTAAKEVFKQIREMKELTFTVYGGNTSVKVTVNHEGHTVVDPNLPVHESFSSDDEGDPNPPAHYSDDEELPDIPEDERNELVVELPDLERIRDGDEGMIKTAIFALGNVTMSKNVFNELVAALKEAKISDEELRLDVQRAIVTYE